MKTSTKTVIPLLLVLSILWLESCTTNQLQIHISNIQEYSEMPSGSGISKLGNRYFVIGDDSPFLFELDESFKIIKKYPLYDTSILEGVRIPKKIKPDFEAIERISDHELIIFGSGSKSPTRDICVRILLQDSFHIETYNIEKFYQTLKDLEEMEGAELNIEAAAYWDGNLSLFNRSNNLILTFDYIELLDYLKKDLPLTKMELCQVKLPKIKGIQAGLSGAEALTESNNIIFTASVEASENSYLDGKVLGSFIGILDISSGSIHYQNYISQVPSKDIPMKVESVTVRSKTISNNNPISLALIVDNDDGTSILLEGKLLLPKKLKFGN